MRKKVDFAQFDKEINITESQRQGYSKDPKNIKGAEDYISLTDKEILDSHTVLTMSIGGSEIEFNGKDELPRTINGAKLKSQIQYEQYNVSIEGGGEQTIGYSINIGSNKYLVDVFEQTPYGIIKKNRTGVGATTLEMKSPRNSIIVVPTKTLAYKKAVSGYNAETRKFKYIYVGSSIENGIDFPSIEEYTSNETIEHKKIIVVADSLGRVIWNSNPKPHIS